MKLAFYIDSSVKALTPELVYVLKIFAQNKHISIGFADTPDNSLIISRNGQTGLSVSDVFAENRLSNDTLNSNCLFEHTNGSPDYLATAFYMLSAQQEFLSRDFDVIGRFKYTNSYQSRFSNTRENIVQTCFDKIGEQLGVPRAIIPSRFFLSHDIDSIHGALFEDGLNVIKKGRVDLLLKMLFNTALCRPDWLNIDKIMKLESEYDCKSTFFWIVNKGKVNQREENADYTFNSSLIRRNFRNVAASGFENGIHKSISSETFAEEITKYGEQPLANRYHYLKYNLPKGYDAVEAGGLRIDASAGFAEEPGFRNSYGLPFQPFNFTTKEPYQFIEVPLHIMDRTYFQYKKWSSEKAGKDIIDFFEKHRQNCVISVLWHNNFFTNYKFRGYPQLYKTILAYIHDNNLCTITQQEIIEQYKLKE